jgi:hypothetical protein
LFPFNIVVYDHFHHDDGRADDVDKHFLDDYLDSATPSW